MILSAGLTPAWQQILVFDSFRYGEVNRAAEAHWCSSGKVFNAGIAVHHLGADSLTLATAGGPPLAQIREEMKSLGVPLEIVETESATRVCTTILDRSSGTMTELVENGRPVSETELDAFVTRFADAARNADAVVLIGTLPQGTPPSYYRRLLAHASCPSVLDFRGEGLLGVLDLEPMVVKPNREELALTVGRELDTDESLVEAMRTLNDRGAQWVVITDGPDAVWLTRPPGNLSLPAAERSLNRSREPDRLRRFHGGRVGLGNPRRNSSRGGDPPGNRGLRRESATLVALPSGCSRSPQNSRNRPGRHRVGPAGTRSGGKIPPIGLHCVPPPPEFRNLLFHAGLGNYHGNKRENLRIDGHKAQIRNVRPFSPLARTILSGPGVLP
jgi:fructose-1-phosphate kinase PfkB-like protein